MSRRPRQRSGSGSMSPGSQYEGVCYLGAGVLVLVVLALVARRRTAAAIVRHRWLAAIAVVTALFALSNHIYLGSHRPARVSDPARLALDPGPVQVSGPVLVATDVPRRDLRPLPRRSRASRPSWRAPRADPCSRRVSLFDVTPDWTRWRDYTAAPETTPLDIPVWRRLLASVDEVEMVPAHDCNSDLSFDLVTQIRISDRRGGHADPTGSTALAGPRDSCATSTTAALLGTLKSRARHTLYVFVAPMIAAAKRLASTDLHCAEISASARSARPGRAPIDSLGWPATPRQPRVPYRVRRRDGSLRSRPRRTSRSAEASVRPEKTAGPWVQSPGFVATPRRRATRRVLACSGSRARRCCATSERPRPSTSPSTAESIARDDLPPSSNAVETVHALRIRRELLDRPSLEIELRPRDFRSPSELGCRRMPREIAVRVHRMWIETGPAP